MVLNVTMGTIDVVIQDYKKAKAQKHPYGFAKVSRNVIQILSNWFFLYKLMEIKNVRNTNKYSYSLLIGSCGKCLGIL